MMSNTQTVDLALTIPSEEDGDVFVRLCDLGDMLVKPMMPEKKLEIIEQIIIKNWMIARSADARLAWAIEYCKEFRLWEHRKIQRDGQTVQEFQTHVEWQRWVYSQCSGLSQRAIDYRQAGVRTIKSLGIGFQEGVELLAEPSGIHQVARLFETDNLSQFEGFVSPEVEQNARKLIGDDGTTPTQEVAQEVTRMILTSADSISGEVDKLLHSGEQRHGFVYDPKGPYLKLAIWRVGGGKRKEYTFVLRQGEGLDDQAEEVLSKYRRK